MECGRALSAIIILALPRITAALLVIIIFLHLTEVANAERVNICYQQIPSNSQLTGTACGFNAQLGEEVNVIASAKMGLPELH